MLCRVGAPLLDTAETTALDYKMAHGGPWWYLGVWFPATMGFTYQHSHIGSTIGHRLTKYFTSWPFTPSMTVHAVNTVLIFRLRWALQVANTQKVGSANGTRPLFLPYNKGVN